MTRKIVDKDELQGGVLQLALEAGRHVRRSEIYCLQNPHSPHLTNPPTYLKQNMKFEFSANVHHESVERPV